MVKIKISYNTPDELKTVLKQLEPIVKACRVSRTETGQYKKAYLELKL